LFKEVSSSPIKSNLSTFIQQGQSILTLLQYANKVTVENSIFSDIKFEGESDLSVKSTKHWGDANPTVVCAIFSLLYIIWHQLYSVSTDSGAISPPIDLIRSTVLSKCWVDAKQPMSTPECVNAGSSSYLDSRIEFTIEEVDLFVQSNPFDLSIMFDLRDRLRSRIGAANDSGATPMDEDDDNRGDDDNVGVKTTRASAGIVKKRVDEDFADPSKLHLSRGLITSASLAGNSSGTGAKRRKVSGKDSKSTEPANSVNTPQKGENINALLAGIEEFDCSFWTQKFDYQNLAFHSEAVVQLKLSIEYWMQVIWAFVFRLKECADWRKKLQAAISSHDPNNASLSSNHILDLLEVAKQRGIKCIDRYVKHLNNALATIV
jgi:hypothetical protein